MVLRQGSISNPSSAAPAIARNCNAATNAASSTIGPREVSMSRTLGFTGRLGSSTASTSTSGAMVWRRSG
jgi:hypothetical protein